MTICPETFEEVPNLGRETSKPSVERRNHRNRDGGIDVRWS